MDVGAEAVGNPVRNAPGEAAGGVPAVAGAARGVGEEVEGVAGEPDNAVKLGAVKLGKVALGLAPKALLWEGWGILPGTLPGTLPGALVVRGRSPRGPNRMGWKDDEAPEEGGVRDRVDSDDGSAELGPVGAKGVRGTGFGPPSFGGTMGAREDTGDRPPFCPRTAVN